MKKTSIVIIFLLCVATFIFFWVNDNVLDEQDNKVADGFQISAYDIVLDVKEDNKIDVTEKILIDFTSAFKHGIYKFTPIWLPYTSKDGQTISRKSKVENLRALYDLYQIDTVNGKKRIRIGDANKYTGTGYKEYEIKYTYDMGKDPFKNFDEFIFHAYGDFWGTTINNPSITVNMPKSIEGYQVNFFADKYRKTNVNDKVEYHIEDNVLIATYNGDDLTKALTLDIELPEGYFVGGSYNYGFKSLACIIASIFLTIYSAVIWKKYGKDHEKKSQTVEFYPPDNLNSAEVGYIYNGMKNNSKLATSLIVQLASKKYIQINETKTASNKEAVEIINLLPIPKKPDLLSDSKIERLIEIKKLKDLDDALTKSQKTMMKFLFKNGDAKSLTTNFDKFNLVRDDLVKNGYIEILSDNTDQRDEEYENNKAIYTKLYEQYEKDFKSRNEKVSKLKPLSEMEQIIYNELFVSEDKIILSDHPTFYTVFNSVYSLLEKLKDKVYDKKAYKKIGGSVFRTVLVTILFVIAYRFLKDLDPNYKFLYLISFICIIVGFIFSYIMERKTRYGETITPRIKGFREFLEKSEKENLEQLVEKEPTYFYDILPYTYVLGLSKKWIKKFENIKMPEISMGSFDYSSDSSLSWINDNVTYPSYSSSSGSSGCSSCGGGCSSCGGGCSSCGGGGSW